MRKSILLLCALAVCFLGLNVQTVYGDASFPSEVIERLLVQKPVLAFVQVLYEDGAKTIILGGLWLEPDIYIFTYLHRFEKGYYVYLTDFIEVLKLGENGKYETLWKAPPAAED